MIHAYNYMSSSLTAHSPWAAAYYLLYDLCFGVLPLLVDRMWKTGTGEVAVVSSRLTIFSAQGTIRFGLWSLAVVSGLCEGEVPAAGLCRC